MSAGEISVYTNRQLISRLLAGLRSRRADLRYRAVMQCFDVEAPIARNICTTHGYHPDEELPDFDPFVAVGTDKPCPVKSLVKMPPANEPPNDPLASYYCDGDERPDGIDVVFRKVALSFLRGHQIYKRGSDWVYFDDNTPTVGHRRDCGHCGKSDTSEGHDGCLGSLPGVTNACCGHGENDCAYVQFEGGTELRGVFAIQYFENARLSDPRDEDSDKPVVDTPPEAKK